MSVTHTRVARFTPPAAARIRVGVVLLGTPAQLPTLRRAARGVRSDLPTECRAGFGSNPSQRIRVASQSATARVQFHVPHPSPVHIPDASPFIERPTFL